MDRLEPHLHGHHGHDHLPRRKYYQMQMRASNDEGIGPWSRPDTLLFGYRLSIYRGG